MWLSGFVFMVLGLAMLTIGMARYDDLKSQRSDDLVWIGLILLLFGCLIFFGALVQFMMYGFAPH